MKNLVIILLLVTASSCGGEQVHFADGSQTQLSHWDGRWLVINYWAEWCGPCRAEIPELNELHDSRVQHGVVVLGVNWDGVSGEKLTGVIERMEIEFPILRDDPYQKYGYERAQQLPVTVILNPQREVVRTLMGPQTEASILANVDYK
ncbi:MAG: thiol-disulfide isomerase/thioredoxin [Limisphaerales bacterium]|jgi:thiol-disulfide isomerase/thioredoxin